MYQKTIAQSVSCSGVGVHSGVPISITLRPAPDNFGICFQRTDLKDASEKEARIKACSENIADTAFCTKLINEFGNSISTVEHLMAAFAGNGITNALVEVDGPELPIMDGSAAPFLFLIECAGVKVQASQAKYIKVLKEIRVETDYGFAMLSPGDSFDAEASLDFASRSSMKTQSFKGKDLYQRFKKELARARTFGFYADAEKLKAAGLAKGASLDNAVVFDEGSVLNPEGLRFENECARHKILDMIGDFYLAGAPLKATFKGKNFGHTLNADLLKALLSDTTAWEMVYETKVEETSSYSVQEDTLPRPAVA